MMPAACCGPGLFVPVSQLTPQRCTQPPDGKNSHDRNVRVFPEGDNPVCRLLPTPAVHANFGKELQKCNWPKAVQQRRGWLLVFSA